MNFELAHLILDAIGFVFTAGAYLYAWNVQRNQASADKVTALDLKVVRLEGELKAVPTEQRMDGVSRAVSELGGAVEALKAELHGQKEILRGVRDATTSINDFLLHQGKGSHRR